MSVHHTARRYAVFVVALVVTACAGTTPRPAGEPARSAPSTADRVTLTVLQMNDVYEITPVSGGAEGGLARVATLRRELASRNPNTIAVLAGDLFSPSALGTARVDGQRLAGRQIVDVMNAVGLDYATFGNHEFDLSRDEFLARMAETKTTWVSSNTRDPNGQSFPNAPNEVVFTITNGAGRAARIGMFGLTLAGPETYVRYMDPLARARETVAALRPKVDVLIAVTHLAVAQDIALVEGVPGIDLVIGGHEHENVQVRRGRGLTPIVKADANARTVYVHDITFDARAGSVDVNSRLQRITNAIPEDPAVAARAKGWVDKAYAAFRSQGFEAERVVATVTDTLDGTETSVRHRSTRLTELITQGMLRSVPGAQFAVFNSGGIRIDDEIPPGRITEYDVIRTLPFGGNVVAVDMKGGLLQRVLDQGVTNAGNGGFLLVARASAAPIEPERTYLVAFIDFLLTGNETGLAFLTRGHPDLTVRSGGPPEPDIRKTFIAELQRQYAGAAGR